MKPAILLVAPVLLAACSAMQAQHPAGTSEVPGAPAVRENAQGEQKLVAAFNDRGTLKKHYPAAELVGTYGEVTIWRVRITPARWNELAALGKYSPVFGEEQGQLRALPGGVIVRLVPALSGQKADDWFRARRLSATPLSALPGTYKVDTPAGLAALEVSKQLGALPEVVEAVPDWWQAYSLRK